MADGRYLDWWQGEDGLVDRLAVRLVTGGGYVRVRYFLPPSVAGLCANLFKEGDFGAGIVKGSVEVIAGRSKGVSGTGGCTALTLSNLCDVQPIHLADSSCLCV